MTPVMASNDARLNSRDQLSSSSRSSRPSTKSPTSRNQLNTTSGRNDGERPPSQRQHASAPGISARAVTGSSSLGRRGTPPMSPRSAWASMAGGRKTAVKSRELGRRDIGDRKAFCSVGVGGVGAAPQGVQAPAGVSNDGSRAGSRDSQEESGRIRVAVRVRPFSEKEKLAGARSVISMTGNQTRILDPAYFDSEEGSETPDHRSMWERTFSFDHSFWSHNPSDNADVASSSKSFSNQADVHRALGEFLMENACKGFNCSLFAYGQTGSGKTYTMLGDSSDLTTAAGPGGAGLIPRICVELFQRLGLTTTGGSSTNSAYRSGQASIQVSFCEIYNEQVRDLFSQGGADGHGLRVREHPTKGAFVEGLSARRVTCYQQVQHLLDVGMSARATAATAMNEVSSRSHAVFTIVITVTATTKLSGGYKGQDGVATAGDENEQDTSIRTSKICLVDLAGSERANATGARGERLREASNINKSLSTLGDVIKALAKRAETGRGSGGHGGGNESFIPYRNSMLTWLLKDSIGGNSKTVMLAAISPVADAYQETMSTLRYVERAKDIVNTITINDANSNPLIAKLRDEVRVLQELLEQKDEAILQHEEKEAVLTAVIERERADDDDKATRALAMVDSLQATLHAEKRRNTDAASAAATASFESAASSEQRHRRELQILAEDHSVIVDKLRRVHAEETQRASEEEAARHAQEMNILREQSLADRERVALKWAEDSELEHTTVEKKHVDAIMALREEHKQAMDQIQADASKAAARAAIEAATVKRNHVNEIAAKNAAAEAKLTGAISRLQKELEREHESATAEARALSETERELSIAEAVKKAEVAAAAAAATALADATAVADRKASEILHEQQDSHSNELSRLRAELKANAEIAESEAIERERMRVRVENDAAVNAAVVAREAELRQEHNDQIRRAREEPSEKTAAAQERLKDDHDREMMAVKQKNAEALASAIAAEEKRLALELSAAREKAKADVANSEEDSKRAIELLSKKHRDRIKKIQHQHQDEVARAIEAENHRREADLAAASKHASEKLTLLKSETAVASETLRNEHQHEIRQLKTTHVAAEAEAQRALAVLEVRHSTRMADVDEVHAAALAASKAEATATLAVLKRKQEEALCQAEQKQQDDVERVRANAEDCRRADLAEAEEKFGQLLQEERTKADSELTRQKERHLAELQFVERENKAEFEKMMVAEGTRRAVEFAQLEASHATVMEQKETGYEATVARLKEKHEAELSCRCGDYDAQLATIRASAAAERKRSLSNAETADERLRSSIATLRAEAEAATSSLGDEHMEELRIAHEKHKAELEREVAEVEQRKTIELQALRIQTTSSVADVETRTTQALASLRHEHVEEISALKRAHGDETARAANAAEKSRMVDAAEAEECLKKLRAECEVEAATAVLALETRHMDEMRLAAEQRELNIQNAVDDATAAATAAAAVDGAKCAAEQEKSRAAAVQYLKEQHKEDLQQVKANMQELSRQREIEARDLLDQLRLSKERHATEVERITVYEEERRCATLVAAELQSAASIDSVKAEHSAQMTAAEERHRLEIHELAEDRDTQRIRAETASSVTLENLKAKHVEAMRFACEERDTAVSKAIADAEAQNAADLAALQDTVGERAVATAVTAKEATMAAAEIAAREHESELQRQLHKRDQEHRAKLKAAEEQWSEQSKKLLKRVECAEASAAEAEASADEWSTRAAALEGMLKASVGSREQELAGHRRRVAQLQAFVARREQALHPTTDEPGTSVPSALPSSRTVQQRVTDLKAMIAGAGGSAVCGEAGPGISAGGENEGAGLGPLAPLSASLLPSCGESYSVKNGFVLVTERELASFYDESRGEGVPTMEHYAEELEAVVVRATVETAAARQDHLEADMQCKSVTRQLVGLKLVHAQLRERLEDTQIKLEHKSQSAARRWLASATRLAQEFARPDRYGLGSLSPRSRPKIPRSMSTNSRHADDGQKEDGMGSRRSQFFLRSRSPPHQRVASSSKLDLGRTL